MGQPSPIGSSGETESLYRRVFDHGLFYGERQRLARGEIDSVLTDVRRRLRRSWLGIVFLCVLFTPVFIVKLFGALSGDEGVRWLAVVMDIAFLTTWWVICRNNLKATRRVAALQEGLAAGAVTTEGALAELQKGSD